jgi:hemolysin activation/secretion protein
MNRSGWVPGGSKKDFQTNRGGVSPDNPVDGNYEILRFDLSETVRAPALLRTLAAGRFISLPEPASPYFSDDWTVHLVARGQWANQPLISTEQYAAGGVDTVRGYLQSERFGDNAWNARLELRTPLWTPPFPGGPLRSRFQLVGFFDAAGLYTQHAGEGQPPYQDLQGIGAGLTASLFDRVTAVLYASHPVVGTEFTDQDVRFNFQVSAGF